MIPDQLLRLADGQSLDGLSAKYTNAIDLDTLRDIGTGTTLYVRIRFDTAYTQASGGADVYMWYADNDAGLSGVMLTKFQFGAAAAPAQGTVIYLPIPPISKARIGALPNNTKKYFLVQFSPYTAAPVGGSWTVDIVTDVNMVEHTYTKGFTVQ